MDGLINIEFFKTPDGDVMYKRQGEAVRELTEKDRELASCHSSAHATLRPSTP